MKYYLLAGEASGDLHGSHLMEALKQKDPAAEFRGLGGDAMADKGLHGVKHIRELAFMGFAEVVTHLPEIFRNIKQVSVDIAAWQPDAVICIDYPGFNLRVAKKVKKAGIPVIYFISPKFWAWGEWRVKKVKQAVDLMLLIFPFEESFYKKHGFDKVKYVGNPLMDALSEHQPDNSFREKNKLGEAPILALLPGSRKQEIARMLQPMLETANQFPDYKTVVACAPNLNDEVYAEYKTQFPNAVFVRGATYTLLEQAHMALVTSGTATLEAALLNVPQVVVYKSSPMSFAIGKRLVKVKFIALVNLLLNRKAVNELLQNEANPDSMYWELKGIEVGEGRKKLLSEYRELRSLLGDTGASQRAADEIVSWLNRK